MNKAFCNKVGQVLFFSFINNTEQESYSDKYQFFFIHCKILSITKYSICVMHLIQMGSIAFHGTKQDHLTQPFKLIISHYNSAGTVQVCSCIPDLGQVWVSMKYTSLRNQLLHNYI